MPSLRQAAVSLLPTPILIVAFRNPSDVAECLGSLAKSKEDPSFDIYVCENGGADAFAELIANVAAEGGPCVPCTAVPPCGTDGFAGVRAFGLRGTNARVFIGNAGENLGYGGGVNRWLAPLWEAGDWPGALLLNPDTTIDPNALSALVDYAEASRKGMITGRIALADNPRLIHTRGLRWRRAVASTAAVGRHEPFESRPPVESIERQLDAPSGSFIYITRDCLERIGLMEERFFLYFEDLDWGLRAKRAGGLGYALDAVVYHKGGTTIGTGSVKTMSVLATYLSFRNRLLFVYSHFPMWVAWTTIITVGRALEFGLQGRRGNMRAALLGTFDGVMRRNGRPDKVLNQHLIKHLQTKCTQKENDSAYFGHDQI